MHNHDRRRGSGTRPRCRVLDIHGGCYRLRQKRQEAFHSRVNILVYRRQGWSTTQPTAGIPQKIHSGPAPTCLMRTESTDNARRVRYCGLRVIVRHQLLRVSSILPERLRRSPVGPVNQLGRNGFRRQGHHDNNSGEITPRDSRERAFPVPHAPRTCGTPCTPTPTMPAMNDRANAWQFLLAPPPSPVEAGLSKSCHNPAQPLRSSKAGCSVIHG